MKGRPVKGRPKKGAPIKGVPTKRARQSRRLGDLAWWYARRLGARGEVIDGLRVSSGLPRWSYPRGGITIGDTYLTGEHPAARSAERIRHELVHREQWRRYGYRMAALYLRAGRDPLRNRFEIDAGLADGGYLGPPDENRTGDA